MEHFPVSYFGFIKCFLNQQLLLFNCTTKIGSVDKYIWTLEYILREDTVESAFDSEPSILHSP